MFWSFPKLEVKTFCTPNSNVGKTTSIEQFLEERLPIKKCPSGVKTLRRNIFFQADTETVFHYRKTCFLIVMA